jgi:hypothetical protein
MLGTARHTHLQRMLQAVAVWVWPPQQVVANAMSGAGGAEEELLDGCRAVLALASIHPAADLDMQVQRHRKRPRPRHVGTETET